MTKYLSDLVARGIRAVSQKGKKASATATSALDAFNTPNITGITVHTPALADLYMNYEFANDATRAKFREFLQLLCEDAAVRAMMADEPAKRA